MTTPNTDTAIRITLSTSISIQPPVVISEKIIHTTSAIIYRVVITMGAVIMARLANWIPVISPTISILFVRTAVAGVSGVMNI
jgi:hypothetical protein